MEIISPKNSCAGVFVNYRLSSAQAQYKRNHYRTVRRTPTFIFCWMYYLDGPFYFASSVSSSERLATFTSNKVMQITIGPFSIDIVHLNKVITDDSGRHNTMILDRATLAFGSHQLYISQQPVQVEKQSLTSNGNSEQHSTKL